MRVRFPRSGRSPGGGNGNSLQYSCLGNFMDRGAWWATGQRVAKSQTWLSKWARRSLFINQSASTVQFSFRFAPGCLLLPVLLSLSPSPNPGTWSAQDLHPGSISMPFSVLRCLSLHRALSFLPSSRWPRLRFNLPCTSSWNFLCPQSRAEIFHPLRRHRGKSPFKLVLWETRTNWHVHHIQHLEEATVMFYFNHTSVRKTSSAWPPFCASSVLPQ